jgi:hypothetical protein
MHSVMVVRNVRPNPGIHPIISGFQETITVEVFPGTPQDAFSIRMSRDVAGRPWRCEGGRQVLSAVIYLEIATTVFTNGVV